MAVEVGSWRPLLLCPGTGRVQVGLVMAPVDKLVDVTAQPSAALRRLADTAERESTPMSAAEASCRRALDAVADRAGSWHAPADTDLLAWFGGAGFPFLRVAYEAGCLPIPEVPRWAVPILAESTARAGARLAFGAKATRPVVAALGRSIGRNPGQTADLSRLALALIARDLAEPDQLAALLDLPGPSWPLRALPTGRLIDEGRRALYFWGSYRGRPERALRILSDTATVEEGPRLLAETIRFTVELNQHGPRRLSNRLTEVHQAYRVRFRGQGPPVLFPAAPAAAGVDREPGGGGVRRGAGGAGRADRAAGDADGAAPGGRNGAAGQGAGGGPGARANGAAEGAAAGAHVVAAGGRRARNQPVGGPRLPPQQHRVVQVTEQTALRFPADVVRVDGLAVGTLRLVLPRTVGDLVRWGALLHNCLADYGRSAASGHSVIIGVEQDGRLRYALELTPDRRVRQFCGRGNHAPAPQVRCLVLDTLEDHGVL